ncbi:ABC transporter substrate-binding protein [Plantactinospora mayteni]|uniref:Branched-chain amino acid ABC transporter substrate-binding protein n=1 Tax=Plantactinospora mayteni TaxID=566021 RepID=A0ABQ4EY60_9ACTN|nr:ABC transporter substrate-binding protein [Plantactinospora mayteni]GIG99594.1 branched-chain amino acid ABC transporter substrate-binding protein [Plantactinospora mayteni]
MIWNARRGGRRKIAVAAIATGVLLSVAACGGSDAPASGEGLPDEIKLVSVNPTTGVVAFAGASANKGYELAVKEINESDLLGGSKIKLEFKDTKSEPQTAASALTSAITDRDVAAVFGSVSSTEAVAMSPLAQKRGMPIIYTQAGSDGVVVGDYTYRATPLMSSYYPIISRFIKEQGYKSVGVMYTSVTPTLQEIGQKTYPQLAKELGFEITKSIATSATTQDFAAPISQLLASKPDVVATLQVGASNPTVMTQLRQAGYQGKVLGNSGASAGNLKPAGKAGDGMVWPVDFNYQQNAESSQKFVAAYRAEYGEVPLNYAAEAYDAAYFLARSMAAADSTDREAIKDAMKEEAAKTFDGALGKDLKWENGTLQVPGVMVEYTTEGEKLLYEGAGE